jgi:hypothetical protein
VLYSEDLGEHSNFYKLVADGETDVKVETSAKYLKELIRAVNKMNDAIREMVDGMNSNLGGKMDRAGMP